MEVVWYQRVQTVLFCRSRDLGSDPYHSPMWSWEISDIGDLRFILWKMMKLDKRHVSPSSHTTCTIFTWTVYLKFGVRSWLSRAGPGNLHIWRAPRWFLCPFKFENQCTRCLLKAISALKFDNFDSASGFSVLMQEKEMKKMLGSQLVLENFSFAILISSAQPVKI